MAPHIGAVGDPGTVAFDDPLDLAEPEPEPQPAGDFGWLEDEPADPGHQDLVHSERATPRDEVGSSAASSDLGHRGKLPGMQPADLETVPLETGQPTDEPQNEFAAPPQADQQQSGGDNLDDFFRSLDVK